MSFKDAETFEQFAEECAKYFSTSTAVKITKASWVAEREPSAKIFVARDLQEPSWVCTYKFDRGHIFHRQIKFTFGRGAAFFSETKPEEKQPPTAQEISAAFNDLYQISQSYFAVNTEDIKHAQGLALAQACDYLAELLRGSE